MQTTLPPFLDATVAAYRSMAAADVSFFWTASPGFPMVADFDPLRVRQVLANGVTNALKYTARGFVQIHVWSACCVPDITDTDGVDESRLVFG